MDHPHRRTVNTITIMNGELSASLGKVVLPRAVPAELNLVAGDTVQVKPIGQQIMLRALRESDERMRREHKSTRNNSHNSARFNRSEFVITDTELKLIAAAARIGLNNIPNSGYSTPAAIGTPIEL
jgi:antitoxin component of MazEF toxin-antitoxin module